MGPSTQLHVREIELPKVEYWILELVVRALYRREYGLIWVSASVVRGEQ